MISFKEHRQRLERLVNHRPKPAVSRSVPDDTLETCPECRQTLPAQLLSENGRLCPHCGHHFYIDPLSRLAALLDDRSMKLVDASLTVEDRYDFPDYDRKLSAARALTRQKEAVVCATGLMEGIPVAVGIMDKQFIMGSMSQAVGEKIVRLIQLAFRKHMPLVLFCASGGARMQEGIRSLVQMGRTAAALQEFQEGGGLYISVLTHPTTGGVSASFASLGDFILAEPKALVGFAGRRVIEQTTREVLPDNFQSAEFFLEKGFVDAIVPRSRQKALLCSLFALHGYRPADSARSAIRKRGRIR